MYLENGPFVGLRIEEGTEWFVTFLDKSLGNRRWKFVKKEDRVHFIWQPKQTRYFRNSAIRFKYKIIFRSILLLSLQNYYNLSYSIDQWWSLCRGQEAKLCRQRNYFIWQSHYMCRPQVVILRCHNSHTSTKLQRSHLHSRTCISQAIKILSSLALLATRIFTQLHSLKLNAS
jgi:hypothetical protein